MGKTTVLNQWMNELLDRGTLPAHVSYMTGELIDDHHVLVRLIEESLRDAEAGGKA